MSHFDRFLRSPTRESFGLDSSSTVSTMSGYSSSNTYETCVVSANGDMDETMQCISASFDAAKAADADNMNHWLLMVCGALVFFMQAGFAMLCAGCVRKKNVQNTMLKNLLDACGAAIAFYVCGFAFAFSRNGEKGVSFIGGTNFFYMGDIDPAFWFFEYAFSATSVTIVAGTLAERCQMAAYLCYSLFLTGFVYPVAARAVWSEYGFLSPYTENPFGVVGVIDFAGSGVVHVTGGMTALIAAHMLGARKGRFTDARGRPLDKPKEFPGHSIALQLMGTMILWFGWYGFNPGSALLLNVEATGAIGSLAAVNTSLAAAAGGVTSLFTNLYLEERKTGDYSFNLTMAMNGVLGGLVAITAGAGTVEPWAACFIGMVAGWVYLTGSSLLLTWKIDDAVDAVPVHLFNGAWGLLATGLFTSPGRMLTAFGTNEHFGWFYSLGQGSVDFQLLCNQVVALLFLAGWPIVTMTPFFIWLNYMGWLRADSLEELVGLDMSYHGGSYHQPNDEFDEIREDDMKSFLERKGRDTLTRENSDEFGDNED